MEALNGKLYELDMLKETILSMATTSFIVVPNSSQSPFPADEISSLHHQDMPKDSLPKQAAVSSDYRTISILPINHKRFPSGQAIRPLPTKQDKLPLRSSTNNQSQEHSFRDNL